MTDEIPDGLAQLREYLLKEFKAYCQKQPMASRMKKIRNFLSRALAAYSIHKLAKCSRTEAANAVVDGGGDGGIDAIYYAKSKRQNTLGCPIQIHRKGTGEPDGLRKILRWT